MKTETIEKTTVSHKQITSLGDQQYPSFELRTILTYLSAQGHKHWCDALLKELNLSFMDLQQPFIPSHIAFQGLNCVIKNFYKPGLGCDIAKSYCLSELGAIGASLGSAETLGEALEISQNYHELLGSFTDIVNIIDTNTFTNRLVDVAKLDPQVLQFLFELTFAGMIQLAEEISGRHVNALCVRFSAQLDEQTKQKLADLFDCTIEDNCKFNEWVIDLTSLTFPVTHNLYSPAEAAGNLRDMLELLQKEQGLVDKITDLLKCTNGDFPDPDMISNTLGMSGRTMRRHLSKMDTSFTALIDKVRCQLAINLIQNQKLSNESLACELGYSDAANFYNAFKKWTGNAPGYYRID
jgi:AraC-like DNA-binding protein